MTKTQLRDNNQKLHQLAENFSDDAYMWILYFLERLDVNEFNEFYKEHCGEDE